MDRAERPPETHTSLPPLVFFRSPQPDHSWVTAAGAVLDAAALDSAIAPEPQGGAVPAGGVPGPAPASPTSSASQVHGRAIVGAERRQGYVWWAYGVHGGGGRWIVNGSGHNVVKLRIDPPVQARVLGVPVKLRELWVSLEDPDGFLVAIGP